MATSINVGAWVESLRSMASGIGDPCYGARAVLAMCDAVLVDALRLAERAALTIAGQNATRLLRDDLASARSRFASYQSALNGVPAQGRSVDDLIACESVLGYLLDGRTSDGTAPVLASPEAQLVASMWNRALVAARTQLAPDDKSASELMIDAGKSALDAVRDAGAGAVQAVDEWSEDVGDVLRATARALPLYALAGAGLVTLYFVWQERRDRNG